MASIDNNTADDAICFDLYDEPFYFTATQLDDNLAEQDREAIETILVELEDTKPTQMEAEVADPEKQNQNKQERFVKMSDEELDAMAGETVAKSTKWQTKWAVKVFTGNFHPFLTCILP